MRVSKRSCQGAHAAVARTEAWDAVQARQKPTTNSVQAPCCARARDAAGHRRPSTPAAPWRRAARAHTVPPRAPAHLLPASEGTSATLCAMALKNSE